MLLPDTWFLLNVIFQCFQGFGLYSFSSVVVEWSCVFFFFKIHTKDFLCLVPGIYIGIDWLVQHHTDQYARQKVQEIHLFVLASFFFSVKVPPFRNHIRR